MSAPITELPERFRPLTREEYLALGDLGVFAGQRVELVGGVIVEMPPINPPHNGTVILLTKLLVEAAGDRYAVACQGGLDLDPISQPMPDFMILSPRDYRQANPDPATALAIIEVADSSLRFDLGEKARRYAMAGVPVYWVIDLGGRTVHVHTDPRSDGTWGRVTRLRDGAHPIGDLDLTIDLDIVLGR